MGAATSTGLNESVVNGDTQVLRRILHSHEVNVKGGADASKDLTWDLELEEAVHTLVALETKSKRHLQQQQIVLELLLHARPEAWSAITSSQKLSALNDAVSTTRSSADWRACHQACATGNLALVAFVLQHYPAQFEIQIRDAFGLFPIDLVPPELLISADEMVDEFQEEPDAMEPKTSRNLQCLVLHRLRERKAKLQDEQVHRLVKISKVETRDNQDDIKLKTGEFYIACEPRRKHYRHDQAHSVGHGIERCDMLQVSYRLPRSDPFLNGYFQLIWRENGDARCEEPNYDPRITRLRDECARLVEAEASLPPHRGSTARSLELSDEKSVVENYFFLDVNHLPADSVCHVLFITCDQRLLHRAVALSTEGFATQTTDCDSDEYFSDSTSEEELTETDFERQHQNKVKQSSYTFFVGGEEFSYPHSAFAGQSFSDVGALENFLSNLEVKKQRRVKEKLELLERLEQAKSADEARAMQLLQADQKVEVSTSKSSGYAKQPQKGEVRPAEIRPECKVMDNNQDDS